MKNKWLQPPGKAVAQGNTIKQKPQVQPRQTIWTSRNRRLRPAGAKLQFILQQAARNLAFRFLIPHSVLAVLKNYNASGLAERLAMKTIHSIILSEITFPESTNKKQLQSSKNVQCFSSAMDIFRQYWHSIRFIEITI